MKKGSNDELDPDMLGEYDFSRGVRGAYAQLYTEGTNMVLLDPDVAEIFPDSSAVNDALRSLVRIARQVSQRPS